MLRSLCILPLLAATLASAQSVDPSLYQELKWRCIGPFRAGRTVGVAGIPDQPNVFYIGVNNGGVWKTTDAGRTWNPIFDDQPTGSIGALAVAPSDPNVIYVGSGEGLQRPDLSTGDGMYKSTDGGKTWTHLGLENAQQIAGVTVDPRDPNKVFVAALGHPYGANKERGIYRSTDGGQHWDRVLYIDVDTGATQVTLDPKNPDIVYADMWAGRQGPWENGGWAGKTSGLYKSTDGGSTWRKLAGGLPTEKEHLGRIGFGIAPSDPNRIYALVAADNGGVYRSDDAGESWRLITNEERLWERGDDFAEIKVDPRNPDVVYDANTCSYKSTDGGKTWVAWKGAPGGDDYHTIWINPLNPQIIMLAADQGATLTVNGGETWSSWYNQPTAQLYHVATDNSFPYRVYSGQQESGSVGILSRGNDGEITFRDWRPVGIDEYGYVAPDPLDPNIVYGGRISRFDWRTGQSQNISPEAVRSGKYRFLRTMPSIFSPADNRTLFLASNVLFKTKNGGKSWEVISPDLSREHPEVPETIGVYKTADLEKMPRRGVIYAVSPSKFDVGLIWAGTDDGLVHVTRDGGKHWTNVTPPALTSWSKVSQIDCGHFDRDTAYISVNRMRLDDMRPHIYRTHDGGRTWKEIVSGMADNAPVDTVREDPQQPGLLYAGTERIVWFSIDDGEHWNPLRMNMPATSIRDLVVKDDDLVIGTHGRSFWILDDITPLRQLAGPQAPSLFKPQLATRVRWNMNTDTPLPPEEPAGQNPPDGAILNYFLKTKPSGPITLEILDSKGDLVRRYSSGDNPAMPDPKTLPYPTYWFRPPQILSGEAGMHRFIWDLHWGPAPKPSSYPMTAVLHDTPAEPHGPWALPGRYTVRLTVDGNVSEQPLTLRMDPRVTTSKRGLALQFELAKGSWDATRRLEAVQKQIVSALEGSKGNKDRSAKLEALLTQPRGSSLPSVSGLQSGFGSIFSVVDDSDAEPTTQAVSAYRLLLKQLAELDRIWKEARG